MRPLPAVLVDAGVWAGWGTAVGFAASRLPARVVGNDGWITRIRPWEHEGRVWDRVAVRRWKDRVPEAGAWFGGISKRRLPLRGRAGLRLMADETRRAELCHWAAAAGVVVMPFWSPAWVSGVMVAYALVANVPFIIIQRYNRARIGRISRPGSGLRAARTGGGA